MTAQRSFAAALTSGGRYGLDVPVAALAGLSVAFLVYAMPGDTLAELVGATGLASLVPAAEPPLGLKARIGFGAAGALAVFAASFLLLRWLDRVGTRPAAHEEPTEMETPRLRRRDFHPDAPPRPPIMAAYELGEPEQSPPPEDDRPGPASQAAEDDRPEPAFQAAEAEEWLLDTPAAVEEPGADPLADPVPDPVPETAAEAAFEAPLPTETPADAPRSGSLDELMSRLEQGLARRRTGASEAAVPADPIPQPPPAAFPGASDDRLQSAIDSLQRLAARGD